MSEKQVILVTGVSGYWGGRVAARLLAIKDRLAAQEEAGQADPIPDFYVIGVDAEPPSEPIKGLDFIQADVRNPLMFDLLQSEKVHTLIHLAFSESLLSGEKAFDLNVIGTMKIMGAASEAGVRKVILRSSTAAYGALPTNPAFIMENQPLDSNKSNRAIHNFVEIEAFVNGFRRQSPEMVISVLRFANVVGPTVESPMTRFLRLTPPLTLLGFDPLMQVIHENDAIEALVFAAQNDVPGVFNVAAEGILPLGKILGLAGRFPLPVIHLCAYWGIDLMKVAGLRSQAYFPLPPDAIRYPYIADLTAMREEMGFVPVYTAEETLREFAGQLRLKKYKPENPDLAYDEERLRDTIERRRRVRELQMRSTAEEQGIKP